jgi:hypothetical protein
MLEHMHYRADRGGDEVRRRRRQDQLVYRYRRTSAARAICHELQQRLPDLGQDFSTIFARFDKLRDRLRSDR